MAHWNQVNKTLLAEADEWGRYNEFRSPVGEYLEELSYRPAPDLEETENFGGAAAGIIDVCIPLSTKNETRTIEFSCSG